MKLKPALSPLARDAETRKLLWIFGALFGAAFAFALVTSAHAQTLATADQIHASVSAWTQALAAVKTAVDAVQSAWATLGWLWVLLAAIPAFSKRIQSVPVLGKALNVLAFNFGAAKNA